MATILRGWARAAGGSHEEGIAELEQGFELSRATGAHMDDPYYFALLADACLRAGRIDETRAAVDAALEHAPAGRRFFFESELLRLEGDLLLRLDRADEAEARLRTAIERARGQNARSLELRAALSAARLFGSRGRDAEGRALVAEAYGAFTEGFDTHDLREARALIGERDARSPA
jgi:predicted ATPase